MCDNAEFEVCRLCLNSRGLLLNVFGENSKLQILLEKTIEDLIDVKVVQDANYPWLVCSACMEKLTEFRVFKRRCGECLSVFNDRIHKGSNCATKDWITNREEFLTENRKDIDEDVIAYDTVDSSAVKVQDGMIVVKEEADTSSGCSAAPEKDVERPMVASIQEGESHWCSNVEARNLDPLEDGNFFLPLNEEVDIKEECYVTEEDKCLGKDLLQEQDGDTGQDAVGNIYHKCQFCNKRFAQKEILEVHTMLLHPIKVEKIRSGHDKAEILDHLQNKELDLTSGDLEVISKEDMPKDVDIPHEVSLGGEFLQIQENGQMQDGKGKDAASNLVCTCQICFKVFAQKDLLKDHVMCVHLKKEMKFRCDVCLKVFKCKNDIERHIKVMHPLEKYHQCQQCTRIFQRLSELKIHTSTHAAERPFKCGTCSKSFSQMSNLKRHLCTHSKERPYKCNMCSKTFKEKRILGIHMLTHSDERQYKCELCSKAFSIKGRLSQHILTHTEKRRYKCQICSKAFPLHCVLKTHMLTHTGERPHKCTICSKSFALNGNLTAHMKTHTGVRPYKCHICSKAFAIHKNLKTHMMTHTRERPHECEICSKAFTVKSDLRRHILTHTGERKYKCKKCSKSFTLNSNLKMHMLIHAEEKPFKCELCPKTFNRKHHLESHSQTHTGDRPHKCTICLKAFNYKSNLNRHMKLHKEESAN